MTKKILNDVSACSTPSDKFEPCKKCDRNIGQNQVHNLWSAFTPEVTGMGMVCTGYIHTKEQHGSINDK